MNNSWEFSMGGGDNPPYKVFCNCVVQFLEHSVEMEEEE